MKKAAAAPTTEKRPVATVLETPALVLCCAGWLEVAEAEELWDELLDADADADAAAEVALALTLLMTDFKVDAVEEELELATMAALSPA